MNVRGITYCIDEYNHFVSMQLQVGRDDADKSEWIPLRKHGQNGGTCRFWGLEPGDYIRDVQYTWNIQMESLVKVAFKTHNDFARVFGQGDGTQVVFQYNAFQPFVGIVSYERRSRIAGFGAYEDDCHMTPNNLPHGFLDFNQTSMDELKGTHASASRVYINGVHGESAHEDVGPLDQPPVPDAVAPEIDPSAKVANAAFEENLPVEVKPIMVAEVTKDMTEVAPPQPVTFSDAEV